MVRLLVRPSDYLCEKVTLTVLKYLTTYLWDSSDSSDSSDNSDNSDNSDSSDSSDCSDSIDTIKKKIVIKIFVRLKFLWD